MKPDDVLGTRSVGADEAAQIAARYGVRCSPDVPVLRARQGALAAPNPDNPRAASETAWKALQRRRRFEAAARRRSEAAASESHAVGKERQA